MSVRCHAQEPGGGSCNQLTEFMGVITRLAMVGPQWQDKLTDEQIGGTNWFKISQRDLMLTI